MNFPLVRSVAFALILTGCGSLLARYDDQTYKSLTSLKGEVKVFMDDCVAKGMAGEKAQATIESFRVKLSQAYEYEAGKAHNSTTVSQIKILSHTFDDVNNRFSGNKISVDGTCVERSGTEVAGSGCLSKGYCIGKSKVLDTAFDLAISTEALKNK